LSATADIHCRGPFKPGGPRVREAGFSLVEVLVAMFVVSIGILALAALLQGAMRYSKMGELRATATLLANDIADRIRANPTGVTTGTGYDLTPTAWPAPLVAPAAACTRATPCSPGGLAHADLSAWTARLRATLPDGSAYVRYHPASGAAGRSVDVWVGWRDPGTLPALVPTERAGTECPPAWGGTDSSVRCIHLQVGL